MSRPAFVEIDGRRYRWRDILEARRAQLTAERRGQQPALFELIDDCRPASQRHADGRYSEPLLFEQ